MEGIWFYISKLLYTVQQFTGIINSQKLIICPTSGYNRTNELKQCVKQTQATNYSSLNIVTEVFILLGSYVMATGK
jgi:hypothetical protein